MRRLNRAAIEDVVYAPTGFFHAVSSLAQKRPPAFSKAHLPFFWGVAKSA